MPASTTTYGWSGVLGLLIVGSTFAAEPAHPDKGPRGGALVELGQEEYHAEVLLEEKLGRLTLYILDGAAKANVPIEAREVLVNLKHAGKPQQFKLPAVALKDDPPGQSSRFELVSQPLAHALHHKGHQARVALKIQGKSYSGRLSLNHDRHHDHAP
jgi:hypothetical protein